MQSRLLRSHKKLQRLEACLSRQFVSQETHTNKAFTNHIDLSITIQPVNQRGRPQSYPLLRAKVRGWLLQKSRATKQGFHPWDTIIGRRLTYPEKQAVAETYVELGQSRDAIPLYDHLRRFATNEKTRLQSSITLAKLYYVGLKFQKLTEVLGFAVLYWQTIRKQKQQSPPKKLTSRLASTVRTYARKLHYIAQKSLGSGHSKQQFHDALQLYRMAALLPRETKKDMNDYFWSAEIGYRLKRYNDAIHGYQTYLRLRPKGKYAQDAVYNTLLLRQRQVAQGNIPNCWNPSHTFRVTTPIPLPPCQQRIVQSINNYVQRWPKGTRTLYLLYRKGHLYKRFGHGRKAKRIFEDVIRRSQRGQKGIDIQLVKSELRGTRLKQKQ